MSHLVTVTGATGNVGGAIAERLLKAGHKVRAIGRNKEKLGPLVSKGAEAVVGDQADAEFLTEAFTGAEAVFAMIPSSPTAEDMRAEQRAFAESIATAIKNSGVKKVVALSSLGADQPSGTGPITGLHEFEEILNAIPGISIIILRPTYFMENFLHAIPIIRQAGFIGDLPRADLAMPMIATRDIAAVAAEYLASPTFEGHSVRELLGPEDQKFADAAALLGEAIGKPDLSYVEFSEEDYKLGLLGAGFSASVADNYTEMGNAMNDGRIEGSERSADSTTPTTLREFAADTFAPAYKGAAAGA